MQSLNTRFLAIRQFSEAIAAPLSAEDCGVQSMPDASPIRWHLAHTTWFFETFLLKSSPGYSSFHPQYEQLFNSYYNAVGEQYPRSQRGAISRPGLDEVLQYRRHVNAALSKLLSADGLPDQALQVVETGLQHEQQHQELMLTDVKHALSLNPLRPVYRSADPSPSASYPPRERWSDFDPGVVQIGHEGEGFCFDNERPRHEVFLRPFSLSYACVTNGQYLQFMEDGGYERPEFWLSAGWATVKANGWKAPLYWQKDRQWNTFTLAGLQPIDESQPVCHISYFEADAYARWAGHRLPTEFEWEHAVASSNPTDSTSVYRWSDDSIARDLPVHPVADQPQSELLTGLGNVWQWTASQYTGYPGYQPPAGALGEYNGKFMCNQFVLRGGSCATPSGHIRPTYRNFFSPDARWQFSGIRLAG